MEYTSFRTRMTVTVDWIYYNTTNKQVRNTMAECMRFHFFFLRTSWKFLHPPRVASGITILIFKPVVNRKFSPEGMENDYSHS